MSEPADELPDAQSGPENVTRLIRAVERGEGGATDELLVAVYDELRKLARSRMRREPAGHTLQATALVHEAYLRILGGDEGAHWDHRGHFFAAVGTAMRRILVERARRYRALRHGGERARVEFEDELAIEPPPGVDLVALDDALESLARQDPRMVEIINLRYFAGLSVEETAAAMGISDRTVKREWSVARAWLYKALGGE
ncbi:MAG: sigma-70 family RNA polymerase sigma factor [Planctomycetes bacterium]|nr:sigma-70 family RNA polymerase sigma factor [Planctomycetota bacterium]